MELLLILCAIILLIYGIGGIIEGVDIRKDFISKVCEPPKRSINLPVIHHSSKQLPVEKIK